MQALKNHRYHSIFADIGETDLTAHVDFSYLQKEALLNNCVVSRIITQSEFLKAQGIEIRAEILKKNANDVQKIEIERGFNRLMNPQEMGFLFKVMSISS